MDLVAEAVMEAEVEEQAHQVHQVEARADLVLEAEVAQARVDLVEQVDLV